MLHARGVITNVMLLNGYNTKLNPSELLLYPWIHRYIQLSTIIRGTSACSRWCTVTQNWTRCWEWETVECSFPKETHVTHHTTKTWESLWMRKYKDCKKSLWWMSQMKHYLLYTPGKPYIWIHQKLVQSEARKIPEWKGKLDSQPNPYTSIYYKLRN